MNDYPLPDGIRSRFIDDVNGLNMHVLEAGEREAPLVLLLHGFPELAFSWRKVMAPLADAGFHVVAPDQRGYGRTTGWPEGYDVDVRQFGILNIARDAVALVRCLGAERAEAVIGHDFGAIVAPWCALIRPDLFRSVAIMSAPFAGAPSFADPQPTSDIHSDLLALDPPRKHYQWYYSGPEAEEHMLDAAGGFPTFLRAYFHVKSADWRANRPCPLNSWSAGEIAKLPTYYVMNAAETMAESVAPHVPDRAADWLTDEDLAVYVSEFERTGLQGGLNWYRCSTSSWQADELKLFDGCRIEVPCAFVSGAADWGVYQKPGAFEAMRSRAASDLRLCRLIVGAGHWVQQEQPEATVESLLEFLSQL